MAKDTQKELERLEAELLAQETAVLPTVEDPEDARLDALLEEFLREEDPPAPRYQNFSNNYGKAAPVKVYNTDRVDLELEEYADAVCREQPRERIWDLLLLAFVLLGGIAAVVIYWLLRFL